MKFGTDQVCAWPGDLEIDSAGPKKLINQFRTTFIVQNFEILMFAQHAYLSLNLSDWLNGRFGCRLKTHLRAATNLENLEKSGNLTVFREKSGKVEKVRENVLPVVCYHDCGDHRISIS